jgi:hypothetical protein
MSRDADDATDESTSRRAALRAIGAGAAIVGFGPAASAAKSAAEASLDASPQDCYYEYDCTGEQCKYGGYNEYRRYCCNYGDGYQCDSWEWYGCC